MPPRRKGTVTTKKIKGTTTEEVSKADDNVSNQDNPLGFAAAAKCRGRKVAISAKENVGADKVDVPKIEVSIRSSKQKALHNILSMDKEDAGDCMTEASASLGERESSCSGAKHNNKKKQGPRAKKALKSIPEDLDAEASSVEQVSKIVSDEVKEVSDLCATEVKPDRGKSRSVRAKKNDQCKLRTEQEEQQVKEPQQEKMTTCHKASRKRGGSSMLAPEQSTTPPTIQATGNLSKKADCVSMPTEKLDPLSALMACAQEPTKLESKKDHALNVRSSTRAKKVVYYNEQSPGKNDLNEKKVSMTAELKAQAATKRNTSAAKLIPGGAKRVKEDPASAVEEALALDPAKAISVKRGRRHQKLSSPQKLLDKKSVAFRGTGNKEGYREHQEESNLKQGNSSSVFFNGLDSDKALLLQTAQLKSIKFSLVNNAEIVATSPAQGAKLVSATRLEKMSKAGSIMHETRLEKTSNAGSIMHEKRESGHVARNQVSKKRSLSEKAQDQMMADESTSLEKLSTTAGEGVLQQHKLSLKGIVEHSIPLSDRKEINTSKGRKVNSKQRAFANVDQNVEGDMLDALPLESAKSKMLKSPLVQGAANPITDAEPAEMCGIRGSVDADNKFYCESQNVGRNTFTRKRTWQGTAKQAKKQKISKSSCLDTLPSTASLDMFVEGAAPAQNQEPKKVIQEVKYQGWNAVDITNSESRVERSSEKKRREEVKRKRAMKFDALPVGFGLGISCWSTPPWAKQSTEGVIEVLDSSVMGFQVQSKSPKKQLYLQGAAMPKDANNTSIGLEDTHHELPCSATEMQLSTFSISDAERLPGSGVPKNDSIQQEKEAKVKRQVARETKTPKESPPAVHTVDTGSDNSMWRSSRRKIATASKEKTTMTKKRKA